MSWRAQRSKGKITISLIVWKKQENLYKADRSRNQMGTVCGFWPRSKEVNGVVPFTVPEGTLPLQHSLMYIGIALSHQ